VVLSGRDALLLPAWFTIATCRPMLTSRSRGIGNSMKTCGAIWSSRLSRRSNRVTQEPHEVILARHGRPLLRDVSPITGDELGAWVRRYNDSGIDRDLPPPDTLRQLAAASRVLASNLPRSIQSATWLSDRARIEPDLREAGLPETIRIPMRLRPDACVVLARAMWWLNWSRPAETIADARERASHVTNRLCELAREHGSVLVVGHGMFNRFVAKCLRERGWHGPRTLPRGYWSVARFVQSP